MADSNKILVTGATGNVGSALLSYLDTTENDVRVLTHDESKAQSLRDQGAEAVVGDLSQQDTLGPAVVGVDTVFLLTPPVPEQVSLASSVIKAAKAVGNDPRIVRLSVIKASHDAPTRISRQHAVIEDEIKSSGLPYTLLRPHYYMQNTLVAAQTVASEGRIYQPFKAPAADINVISVFGGNQHPHTGSRAFPATYSETCYQMISLRTQPTSRRTTINSAASPLRVEKRV
jgi:uncharacterized protein YbjT (DUF2867 family)